MESPNCLPGVAYNYPSLWARGFATLGITEESTETIGLFMIALFCMAVLAICALAVAGLDSNLPLVPMAAAALSPPVLLVLERGNIDIIVFVLVVAAVSASTMGRGCTAALLFAMSTALKLFPLGGGLTLIKTHGLRVAALFVGLSSLGLMAIAPDLPLIARRTPQEEGASFGAPVIFLLVIRKSGLSAPDYAARILGVAAFILVFVALAALRRRLALAPHMDSLVKAMATDRAATSAILSGFGCFLMAYLIGTNWDYRLIFLIPPVAGLARLALSKNPVAIGSLVVLVVQMWLSYPAPGPVEYLSDALWLVLAPLLALFVCQAIFERWAQSVPTQIHSA
jgi:hypothetical protein